MQNNPYRNVYKISPLNSPIFPKNRTYPVSPQSPTKSWSDYADSAQNQFLNKLGKHLVRNRQGAILQTTVRAASRLAPQTYADYVENISSGGGKKSKWKYTKRKTRRRSHSKRSRLSRSRSKRKTSRSRSRSRSKRKTR